MKKHIYGFDYEVVYTEMAELAVKDFYTFNGIDDPESEPHTEQIWWRVAEMNAHETMWMNNCDGEILIITDGPESYYRIF